MKNKYSVKFIHAFFRDTGIPSSCSFTKIETISFNETILKIMKTIEHTAYTKNYRIDIESEDK